MRRDFWKGKRVLVTGHSGMKGGWLAIWLRRLGATVYGYALTPPTEPNLFDAARVGVDLFDNCIADIRNPARLESYVEEYEPEIVFHLAAQPLVRRGYDEPLETFETNVMGTATLLEACRIAKEPPKAIVVVTTDKVYMDRGWLDAYRENDAMGDPNGPYDGSKMCAETVTHTYRRAYGLPTVTVRAGNVIGGGDFAEDRIVPDYVRAKTRGESLTLRMPRAVRPWQHVLDPLHGYMMLAERIAAGEHYFCDCYNFGPRDFCRVGRLVDLLDARWGGEPVQIVTEEQEGGDKKKEANLLRIDASRAEISLGWWPSPLGLAICWTADWYRSWHEGEDMREFTLAQIEEYEVGI